MAEEIQKCYAAMSGVRHKRYLWHIQAHIFVFHLKRESNG
jgi:hypothetical protein